MDASRWRRLRELLEAVAGLPAAERERALLSACGTDETLLADARSLLARHGADDEPGDAIVAGAVADFVGSALPGGRVGPYEVVREVGQGGMGAVYLARRADGEFDRQVALKLVKPGLATEEFLRRFRAERQILARLQHPQIARLLDGGVDDLGRPYFALEFVEGEPIDRYCAARRLGVEDGLALFLDACQAVAYAHANLVIHRDLKPAHILVTPDRQVRLLDFGIAKMLGDDEMGAGLTDVGIRALTPEYASPEQVRGEPAGTASDVYSLGVILYELLTGARPYEIDGRRPADVERVVCSVLPDKPSTRVTDATGNPALAAGRQRRLRGDLDVICLKALQKDPSRRYSSVEAFADDLRRHLAGRPVLARPDSFGYRSGRFISRHRAGVVTAAAVVVIVAGLIGVYTWRLTAARDRARVEAAKADQIATFLRGLFEVADPSTTDGRVVTARELLDEGAARIDRELTSQPAVRASMMRLIGEVYNSLGLYPESRTMLERALVEHRALFGDAHDEVATTELTLAITLQNLGEVEAAERLMRSGLAAREQLLGEQHEKVSEAVRRLAFLLETRGHPDQAEDLYRRALATDRVVFPEDHPRVAKAVAELAGLLRREQRLDEAEPLLREALAAQRRHYGDRDLTVASTMRNLGSLLRDRGAFDEAETLYREAIAIRRALQGDQHQDVGIALNSLGLLLERKGDPAGAAAAYREAIAIAEHMFKGQPHADLAATYHNLASILHTLGQLDDAAAMFTRSIAMVDAVLEAGHPNRAFARVGLAAVYLDQQRFTMAEPLLREALALRRAALPAGHRYIGDTLLRLGECLTGLRRFDDAEAALLEAQRMSAASGDENRSARVRRRLDALHAAGGERESPDEPADTDGVDG
jgi:serine/threonine-protein kinase